MGTYMLSDPLGFLCDVRIIGCIKARLKDYMNGSHLECNHPRRILKFKVKLIVKMRL